MEIEKLPPYVIRRNAVYYYRRKVPLDLIELFGSNVITQSLKTKDLAEAKVQANIKSVEFDNIFKNLRSGEVSAPVETQPELPSPVKPSSIDIKNRTLRTVDSLRRAREIAVNEGRLESWTTQTQARIELYQSVLRTGRDDLEEIADLTRAEVFLYSAKHILHGEPLPFIEVYSPSHQRNEPVKITVHKPSTEPTLEQLVSMWAKETDHAQSSRIQILRVIQRFTECTKKDRASLIFKSDVVSFKDFEKSRNGGLESTTVNSNLSHLKTILGFAVMQDIIQSNPAQDVKIKIKKTRKEERISFTNEQLNLIFNTEIYTQSSRPLGGGGAAAYWLPVIALYTGARLEEICQLRKIDIKQKEYFNTAGETLKAWIFDINEESENNSIKNVSSVRIIPIHSMILELGFLEYLDTFQDEYIFPELNPTKLLNKRGGNWSKWFMRQLRNKLRIIDTRVVFHSFRHTFKDLARSARIDREVHQAITGHSMGSEGDNYGGEHFPLLPLVEAMDKYVVPNLVIKKFKTFART